MITVKQWKEITVFEPIKNGELDVDGTVKIIADIKNIPVEDVENLPISELLPTFLECVHVVNEEVFSKIKQLPKNGEGDGK